MGLLNIPPLVQLFIAKVINFHLLGIRKPFSTCHALLGSLEATTLAIIGTFSSKIKGTLGYLISLRCDSEFHHLLSAAFLSVRKHSAFIVASITNLFALLHYSEDEVRIHYSHSRSAPFITHKTLSLSQQKQAMQLLKEALLPNVVIIPLIANIVPPYIH